MTDEYEETPQILLKDASALAKKNVLLYWQHKLMEEITEEQLNVLFGDDTFGWQEMEAYSFEEGGKFSLDSSHREILNGWIYMRVMGEDMPGLLEESRADVFAEKVKSLVATEASTWNDSLYDVKTVRQHIRRRMMQPGERRFDIDAFDDLPEHITIKGWSPLVEKLHGFLSENKEALNAYLTKKD